MIISRSKRPATGPVYVGLMNPEPEFTLQGDGFPEGEEIRITVWNSCSHEDAVRKLKGFIKAIQTRTVIFDD